MSRLTQRTRPQVTNDDAPWVWRRRMGKASREPPGACSPRGLRPMVAVARDYNAQGPLDTSIGRIIWEARARGQIDMRGHVTHGPPCLYVKVRMRRAREPRLDTWHHDGVSQSVHVRCPHESGARPTLHLPRPSHACRSMIWLARPPQRPQTDIDSPRVRGYTHPCQAQNSSERICHRR